MSNQNEPAQLDPDARIHNIENEIQLCEFQKESLEMDINKFIRPKLTSTIVIAKSISEAKEGFSEGFKTEWKEEDMKYRYAFYNAYNELLAMNKRIMALQDNLDSYKKQRGQSQNTTATGYTEQKLKDLVTDSKMLVRKLTGENKRKLQHLIDTNSKGFIKHADKVAFYNMLKNQMLQFK